VPKSTQRQFLVKIGGIDGYFATKTGGNITADSSKVYDGGDLTPDVLTGPSTPDNITCGRPYDPMRDGQVLRSLRRRVGSWTTVVSVTETDRDLVAIGPPVTYPKAVLVGLSEPEVNAGSGDAAEFTLEFAVTRAAG